MNIEAYYILKAIAMDWANNYLTIEGYANNNGISVEHAKKLIELAKAVRESGHTEA